MEWGVDHWAELDSRVEAPKGLEVVHFKKLLYIYSMIFIVFLYFSKIAILL